MKSTHPIRGRAESLITGKKVIHVGCIDHLPLLESKVSDGTQLHDRINKITKESIGIDINEDGVKKARELGYKNVYYHDLLGEKMPLIVNNHWDYLLLGEMIEHIDDPTQFLRALNNKYSSYVDKIIITTPNAFRLDNFKFALRSIESINTDHRYWFSPYTLSKAVTRAGIEIETLDFTYGSKMPKKILMRWFYNRFPVLAMNLICIGKL